MDKKAMYKLSYGLFILTTKVGDKDNGCVINTAIQAASEPNQISIAVNKANYTHDMIFESGEFNVSVISKDAKFDLFKRFGFQTGREVDKFADYSNMTKQWIWDLIQCLSVQLRIWLYLLIQLL